MSASLTGLTPGTTYHYRLVATSDAGTGRGADATFTTVGVTLATPALRVVYGRGLTLSGSVPVKRAGETVTVFAQPFGEGSFRSIATVLTAADGTWRYVARPRIRTSYLASWNGGRSGATEVGVGPAVSLRRTSAGLLSTRVTGARSFAGRFVQLQRRTAAGRWVTIKRLRLNKRSTALFRPVTFRAALPRGKASTLRIAISVNQAGAGYLGGFSRTILFRRACLASRGISLRGCAAGRSFSSCPCCSPSACTQAQGSEGQEPLRVLFVGNSLTATNDLPAVVATLAKTLGPSEIEYRTIAPGGVSLEDHWARGDCACSARLRRLGRHRHAARPVVAAREPGQPARVGASVSPTRRAPTASVRRSSPCGPSRSARTRFRT